MGGVEGVGAGDRGQGAGGRVNLSQSGVPSKRDGVILLVATELGKT